jgi:hypothetical protein
MAIFKKKFKNPFVGLASPFFLSPGYENSPKKKRKEKNNKSISSNQ